MSVTAEIATDLLTPLGAYLRLREGARAAFLLESVERGRLGRHSFVGRGSRIVDLAEAEVGPERGQEVGCDLSGHGHRKKAPEGSR